MVVQQAPYGTWKSPITAEAITKGVANTILDVIIDPATSEVITWKVDHLKRVEMYSFTQPLIATCWTQMECENECARIWWGTSNLIDAAQKTLRPLLKSGADLYAQPRFSPDGRKLAWVQWFHPDMPWEGGELHVADVSVSDDNILRTANDIHVAGVRESACSVPFLGQQRYLDLYVGRARYCQPMEIHGQPGHFLSLAPRTDRARFWFPAMEAKGLCSISLTWITQAHSCTDTD
ncbi:hypothetical protein CPC08DRAFT_722581 [Agrocybe pediades]|nr:hypothetical protein CPC08DRAFT_722581 [Agrocybe pediades]